MTSYFEIDAKAGMAHDTKTGEDLPAYLKVSTEHNQDLTKEEIEEVHRLHAIAVSEQIDVLFEHLHPISEEEYDSKDEDGDTE